METSIIKQAAKFLREQKNHRRWLAVFLCLAMVVSLSTVWALTNTGSAMTHTQKVLNCQYEVHQHTEDCYDEEGLLTCGYADYVVHTHNDDCYDESGSLVCPLSQVEPHTHDESCYQEQQTLVCGLEESEGHHHTDACYATEQISLICTEEEHQHEESCYDENGSLICELAEHTHTEDCYSWATILTCEQEEGEGAHTHSADCYITETVLACGKLENHTHTEDCYDEDGNLICTETVLEEHTHSSDCFETVELTNEEVAGLNAGTASAESSTSGALTTDPDAEAESSTSGDLAADPDAEIEEPVEQFTQTVEGEGFTVTATYTAAANLPEEAELRASMYDEDSDEFRQRCEEAGVDFDWLFKIGFYVDDQEVEPEDTVSITIQMEGSDSVNYDIIHFADDGMENLTGQDNGNGVEFEANGFSDFGISVASTGSDSTSDPYVIEVEEELELTYETTYYDYSYYQLSVADSNVLEAGKVTKTSATSGSRPFQTTTYTYSGTVTGLAAGTKIKVTLQGRNYTWNSWTTITTFYVTVVDPTTPYSATKTSTISVGKDTKITTATFTAEDGTSETIDDFTGFTWTSSNTTVAKVSGGTVTAVASGTATITGTKTENGKTYTLTWTVTVPQQYTVTFNANDGGGTVPDSITVEGEQEITFPEAALTKSGYVFVGWSTKDSHDFNGNTVVSNPIYAPGDTTVVTGDTTYYAVWATGNANATFYIALDGVPRNEPRVVDDGGADNGYFTSGVTIAKALKVAKFYANSAGVDDNLNAQPTAKQLYDMVSDALTNKKTILVGGVQITSVELSEDKQKLLITGANDSNLIGQELYVIWYVTKYATAGSILSGYTSTNWHVDGVLLTKGKVTLYYDAGAPSGSVKNLPDGAQYDKDTEGVVVGSDRGNNTKVLEPTRTGYNFAGWKMYTMDENGEFTVFVDDYNTEDTFTITEDTCLVAQWTRGTNFLTATKTNTEGTPLKGAKFTLESRQDADSEWVAVGTEQTSNENGVFTFSGLENFTIYCLTESYAPNGYETRNSVCFSVQTDEHDALQLFICDEYGNPLSEDKVPSWIKKGYAATDSTGNGLAQLTITIADEAIEQEVNFVKQDDAGKPLADVGFELYDENGTKLLGTATSDANGKFNFSNLKDGKLAYGTYVLKETNTSAGFAAAPDITFTINDPAGNDKGLVVSGDRSDVSVKAETVKYIDRNDNVDTTRYSYTVTITNTFSPEVKVLKASSDGNQPLSGAEFDLYRVVDDEETKIETNSPLVSGEDGMLSLGNLSNGTYKLVETKAPAGYNLLSEAVIITVHKNSHGVTATGTGPVTKNEDGSIYTITVYNSTGKELPHTGGSGTYLYTFGGLAILAVGCVYGFSMRRKRERGVE